MRGERQFEYGREPGARGEFEQGSLIQGVIVSAGPDQVVITDLNGQNRRTLHLGTTTEIMINGQKTQISDLKPGMHVTLTPDKNNAQEIQKIETAPEGAGQAPGERFQPGQPPRSGSQTTPPSGTERTNPPSGTERTNPPTGTERTNPPSATERSTEPLPKPKDQQEKPKDQTQPQQNPDSSKSS
jgi:hypothetical protein